MTCVLFLLKIYSTNSVLIMEFKSLKGNKYIELLSTNNKILIDRWKIQSGVKKEYDAELKTYIYNIGGNSPVTQMHLPKDTKQKLDLYYPLLVLQLCFPIKSNILCDIGITSHNSQRKRITLSSNQKSKRNTTLFTVLPFSLKNFNTWINVLVDIEEIVSEMSNNSKLKSIDFLSLSGMFRLKRIFLLTRDLISLTEGAFVVSYNQLPKQMSLSRNIPQLHAYVSSSRCSMEEFSTETNSEVTISSSRTSSRSTCITDRHSTQEDNSLALLEKNKRTNCMNLKRSTNYGETCKREFNLNLSMLTFSKEMKSEDSFNYGEIPTQSSIESNMYARNLTESITKDNAGNIELWMPLCETQNK